MIISMIINHYIVKSYLAVRRGGRTMFWLMVFEGAKPKATSGVEGVFSGSETGYSLEIRWLGRPKNRYPWICEFHANRL
jgi:hypothetical protein